MTLATNQYPAIPLEKLVILADYTYSRHTYSHPNSAHISGAGPVYTLVPDSVLDENSRTIRARIGSGGARENIFFAVVCLKRDDQMASCLLTVDANMPLPLMPIGVSRKTFKIERVKKHATWSVSGEHGPAGGKVLELETVEWDVVDDIWSFAQTGIDSGGKPGLRDGKAKKSFWECCELATEALEEDWRKRGLQHR